MKVVCAWCQKSLPDKAPLEDLSVSHGICPKCAKAFEGEIEKNPKGYSGTLKLPIYIDTAISGVLNEGPRSLDWMWDRRMSVEAKKHFHDFLVSIHHPLAYEGMTPEQRFKRFVMEYVFPYIEKNPGAAWHGMKELEADQQDHHAKKRTHKDFFHGKSVAHLESKLVARAMKMNPGRRTKKYRHGVSAYDIVVQHGFSFIRGDGHSSKGIWYNRFTKTASGDGPALYVGYDEKRKRWVVYGDEPLHRGIPGVGQTPLNNPLAVFTVGNPKRRRRMPSQAERRQVKRAARRNPPNRLNVGIAGVVYNRALEIRAEKTEYQPGLYKHPFDQKSCVEVLALDNGDLLLHSTVGVRLWGPAT